MLAIVRTTLLLLMCVASAHAHDPGLSRADVYVDGDTVVVSVQMASADLRALAASDDLRANRSLDVLARGLVVTSPSGPAPLTGALVKQQADDGAEFELQYYASSADDLTLELEILSGLPRGHRLFLTQRSRDGSVLENQLVAAGALPIPLIQAAREGAFVMVDYIAHGLFHIWIGVDHIAFLLTMLLPIALARRARRSRANRTNASALSETVQLVTIFTVAHSITLVLATIQVIRLPVMLTETVIAVSVLVAAIVNMLPRLWPMRRPLTFAFGLIHGCGFASVLNDLSLPEGSLISALVGFNVGVELGQLVIVALAFPLLLLLRSRSIASVWVVRGGSIAASLVACAWIFERAL